ncbi:MAG: outer rane beta-barrel protein [Chitinophagaceae bacterium]|nr:outer rane beta-barrel protein [Chitinophagaceae bacterium]
MRKLLSTLSIIILCSAAAAAQSVSGSVKDADNKLLINATVQLLNAKDSSIAKFAVTDANGHFKFGTIKNGRYVIGASFVGYAPKYSAVFEYSGSEISVPELSLSKPTGALSNVTVTSKKPMVEVRADKTILNVEGSINAIGQDALELLRKSPGVLVDKDENISLSGKNGVQVYIDGKPSPLGGKDLSDYLKTIQSSQIESIELITNPSAKYEAAGNAGIINIKLKKNKAFGTNGSVNAGYSIGVYPKYNTGIALNNRGKKWNLFGNYNYNNNKGEQHVDIYRLQLDTLFDQHSLFSNHGESHNFKAGADYYATKVSTFGVMVTGGFSEGEGGNSSRTPIIYQPSKVINRILVAENSSTSKRDNTNYNFNYRYANAKGAELNVDADYGMFRIKSDQNQPNIYYDATGNNIQSRVSYNMLSPNNIDMYSVKADYEQNYKKGRLGFGGKFFNVKSDNNFQRFNVIGSGKIKDTLRSNGFNYKENINALYVNYNKPFKGFMIQFGVRMENTTSKGSSSGYKINNGSYVTYDSTFTKSYNDFFPSAAITFNKNPMSQFTINYSRRIDRPVYQDLNPFEFKLDEYTFQKGNTQLRPQYTNSVGFVHVYKYKLTTSINYSHVKDVFTQLIDTAERSKAFVTKKNLADQDIVSLNVSYPFQYKWYSLFFNVNAYYAHYKANFGPGRVVDLNAFATNLYAQQTFKLSKTITGELSTFFNSPTVQQGTFKSRIITGTDIGLSKVIFAGKGTVKATMTDVFHTLRFTGVSEFAGQYTRVQSHWESQQFRLNFSYRFGSNLVKAARQRKTAADEESKRVGQGGGGSIGGN